MYWRVRYLIVLLPILHGCASFAPVGNTGCASFLECVEEAKIVRPTHEKLVNFPPPNQKAVVAVYKFQDLTGQRKSSQKMALFSTAVTQGADHYLIDSLRSAGKGNWFVVVERNNLDALTRERQLIKSTRQSYDGENGNTLKPLLFAGIIIEGAIIQYDTNIGTGGNGRSDIKYYGFKNNIKRWREQRCVSFYRNGH